MKREFIPDGAVSVRDLAAWILRQPQGGIVLPGNPNGWMDPRELDLCSRKDPVPGKGQVSLICVMPSAVERIVKAPLKGDGWEPASEQPKRGRKAKEQPEE